MNADWCYKCSHVGSYTALGSEDPGEDDWLNADDDEWEKNWNSKVNSSGSTSSSAAGQPAAAQPVVPSNPNDFESYNPLSKVAAKPKSKTSDDDLWDMLNN